MVFSFLNSCCSCYDCWIYIFIKDIRLINFDFIFGDYSPTGGGGIWPMIVTTIYTIVISLVIATPIGILAAVYLQEYAKQGRLVRIIRFATESLTGIPSIIYGLFGAVFFVTTLKFGMSIIAASLTLTIIVLPVIIRTTEEALKTVPGSYREGSLALGTTKLQTLYKSHFAKFDAWNFIRNYSFNWTDCRGIGCNIFNCWNGSSYARKHFLFCKNINCSFLFSYTGSRRY